MPQPRADRWAKGAVAVGGLLSIALQFADVYRHAILVYFAGIVPVFVIGYLIYRGYRS